MSDDARTLSRTTTSPSTSASAGPHFQRQLPLELFDATSSNPTTQMYIPDTIDFRQDGEARRHWLHCFHELIGKFAAQAARDTTSPDAASRAEAYRNDYVNWLEALKAEFNDNDGITDVDKVSGPTTIKQSFEADVGVLSMRTMLEHSEGLLRKHGFADPWRDVKRAENTHAVAELPHRLAELDAMRAADIRQHWTELFRGMFAGNVFDWGAAAVTQIREQRGSFGLTEALSHIQQRPWHFDDMDRWLERVEQQVQPHRCAAVFVDNSGADVVLGVLPFVRELLRIGTKVILCANRSPSLNDVTCAELRALLSECGEHCETLRQAFEEGRLQVADNGQSGPCLDMRHLSNGRFF